MFYWGWVDTVALGARGHGEDVGAGVRLRHAHPAHDLACQSRILSDKLSRATPARTCPR